MVLGRRAFLVNSMLSLAATSLHAKDVPPPPSPYGALPSKRQLAWHDLETYSFLHFTINTFTNKEWGYGDEDPSVFNPTAFDPDAIVAPLKAGGMKGVILTCKHHDGFCLWPTKTTEHCIRNSSWRGGKGDVVREISDAARRHGLKFGVYVSPWDRNNPAYGTPAYLPIYRQQITELLTNYGPIFEIWFDGANGGDGYYGGAKEKRTIDKHTFYDWPNTWEIVRRLQPQAVIFSDAGPDVRWVGNEKGFAGETCWATFDPVSESGSGNGAPGDIRTSDSVTGTRNGTHWIPAECDVSIRPGWFWHEAEDAQVKSPQQLMELYFKSVGRGASLLLNVPPDRRGLLADADIASLKGFNELQQEIFNQNLAAKARLQASNVRANSSLYGPQNLLNPDRNTYWATDDSIKTPELTVAMRSPETFNVIRLREAIQLGQRIAAFALDAWQNGTWVQIAQETSIGSCKLVQLKEPIETDRLRLRITDSPVSIALAEFGIFSATAL